MMAFGILAKAEMNPFELFVTANIALGVLILFALIFMASRYRRCPPDKVMVIYGRVGAGKTARCLHGGGALVFPILQDAAFLSLEPMKLDIPLQRSLPSDQKGADLPGTFIVAISTSPAVLSNAAERLLGLQPEEVAEMAKEIIITQLRVTFASVGTEGIDSDPASFLKAVHGNVEPALNTIGLHLVNVNIAGASSRPG